MNVIICDDQSEQREHYAKVLNALAKKHDVNLNLTLRESAIPLLFDVQGPHFNADLIFMDIHMPRMTGDEAARKLREYGYTGDIIFLTVSEEHILSAFDVDALHYIVKGKTSMEKFEEVFLRAVESEEQKKQEFVLHKDGGESRYIPLKSIRYYEIYRKIVTVYYKDKNTSFQFPLLSMETLENELSEYGFFRIHKSILVALRAIESVTRTEVTLRDGKRLPLSKNRYAELREKLELESRATTKSLRHISRKE